jgi:hypothetical protein
MAFQMQHWLKEDPAIASVMFSFMFPMTLCMAAQGAFFLGMAIRNWHGNAIRVLLLKLVDEHRKESGGGHAQSA